MYSRNRVFKGQIYYVSKAEKKEVGSEQKAGRAAIKLIWWFASKFI